MWVAEKKTLPVTRSITYTVMKILLELSKPSPMTKARLGFMYLNLSPRFLHCKTSLQSSGS